MIQICGEKSLHIHELFGTTSKNHTLHSVLNTPHTHHELYLGTPSKKVQNLGGLS